MPEARGAQGGSTTIGGERPWGWATWRGKQIVLYREAGPQSVPLIRGTAPHHRMRECVTQKFELRLGELSLRVSVLVQVITSMAKLV